jgi:hypothetical protein
MYFLFEFIQYTIFIRIHAEFILIYLFTLLEFIN